MIGCVPGGLAVRWQFPADEPRRARIMSSNSGVDLRGASLNPIPVQSSRCESNPRSRTPPCSWPLSAVPACASGTYALLLRCRCMLLAASAAYKGIGLLQAAARQGQGGEGPPEPALAPGQSQPPNQSGHRPRKPN